MSEINSGETPEVQSISLEEADILRTSLLHSAYVTLESELLMQNSNFDLIQASEIIDGTIMQYRVLHISGAMPGEKPEDKRRSAYGVRLEVTQENDPAGQGGYLDLQMPLSQQTDTTHEVEGISVLDSTLLTPQEMLVRYTDSSGRITECLISEDNLRLLEAGEIAHQQPTPREAGLIADRMFMLYRKGRPIVQKTTVYRDGHQVILEEDS